MIIDYKVIDNKYYLQLEGWPTLALSFEEVEDLKEMLHNLVQDVYSAELNAELFGDDDCVGCKI